MNRKLSTVKALCAAQKNPFYEVCGDDGNVGMARRRLIENESTDLSPPYVYCGLVQDIQVFGRTFLYARDESVVFQCQSYQSYKLQGLEECLEAFIDRKRTELFKSYVEEECIFLGGMWTEPTDHGLGHVVYGPNFGHFIFEYLNRLVIFDVCGLTGKLPVVVYDTLPERWIEFITLLGVPEERLIRVPIIDTPAYRKVWVSSACHYRDTAGKFRFWAGGLHWLRFRLLSAIGGPRIQDRRRIYIGREDARWRKIVNEDAVKHLLTRYGFEFPSLAQMSARAQIEAISGADLVVSALGAGSILTHFAPEHCINLVLAPPRVGTGFWGGLGGAIFLRQPYERIDCEAIESRDGRRDSTYGVDEVADYQVDLGMLQGAVELALKHLSNNQCRDPLRL